MTAQAKQARLWATFSLDPAGMPELYFNVPGRGRFLITRDSEYKGKREGPSLRIAGETTRTYDAIGANIAAAKARGLPMLDAEPMTGGPVAICGPGPALLDMLDNLRAEQARGVPIWALKGTWRTLVAAGIVPDAVVMLDAHPSQVAYTEGRWPGMAWFMSTMTAPNVLDALEGERVYLWEAAEGKGVSVAMHATLLALERGYIDIRLYGHDCSWSGARSHLYELANKKAMLAAEPIDAIFNGAVYTSTREMCVDARAIARLSASRTGASIRPCGRGLLPDICRAMNGLALRY